MPISTPPLNPHPFPSNWGRKRTYCMVCGSSFSQCDGQRAAAGGRPHIAVDTGDGACRRPPLGGRTRLVVIIMIIIIIINNVDIHCHVILRKPKEASFHVKKTNFFIHAKSQNQATTQCKHHIMSSCLSHSVSYSIQARPLCITKHYIYECPSGTALQSSLVVVE